MTAVGVMLAKSKDKNQSRTSDVKFTAMPHLARGFA